jgi:hypothetical protein
MVSFAKKVHFDKDGSGNITEVIYQTKHEDQPTAQELCGDTSATMRGAETNDPDFCTLGYMRHLRLRQFRENAMNRRNEIWRTNEEKMVDTFTLLRLHYKDLKCKTCRKEFLWGELTPSQRLVFAHDEKCSICYHTDLFDKGVFRTDFITID